MNELLAAVWTGFGFLLMYLLVPGQLLLGVEDLPAVTDVVLELLLEQEVMFVAVLHHVGMSAEGLIAETTLDRGVARVSIVVLQHLLFGDKPLLTHLTSAKKNSMW